MPTFDFVFIEHISALFVVLTAITIGYYVTVPCIFWRHLGKVFFRRGDVGWESNLLVLEHKVEHGT
jgi:hypothetical protein